MSAWSREHGEILKRSRLQEGLSRQALARQVGCSSSRIAELEKAEAHGRRTGPSLRLWGSLRDVLGETIPVPPVTGDAAYKNRTLDKRELVELFKPLLVDVIAVIDVLATGDDGLGWALRRKLSKELQYLERGKPMARRKLKTQKIADQDGNCAACFLKLPDRGSVLDRIMAMDGYTFENTRVLCPECDSAIQDRRGFR